MSNYFSANAVKCLIRFGDLIIPSNEPFPSFSEYGGVEYLDDMLEYAGDDDVTTLNILLGILSFMPDSVLRWVIRKTEESPSNESMMGGLFRELHVGLRGILFSCYYAGKPGKNYTGTDPLDLVGYDVKRVVD